MAHENQNTLDDTTVQLIFKQLSNIEKHLEVLPEIGRELAVMKSEADNHWEATTTLKLEVMSNKTEALAATKNIHERIDSLKTWQNVAWGGGVVIIAFLGYLSSILSGLGDDYIKSREVAVEQRMKIEQVVEQQQLNKHVLSALDQLAEIKRKQLDNGEKRE